MHPTRLAWTFMAYKIRRLIINSLFTSSELKISDASPSSTFRSLHHRIMLYYVGIMVRDGQTRLSFSSLAEMILWFNHFTTLFRVCCGNGLTVRNMGMRIKPITCQANTYFIILCWFIFFSNYWWWSSIIILLNNINIKKYYYILLYNI